MSSESCSDWTSTSGNGEYEISASHTGGNWINDRLEQRCLHWRADQLYCINQQPSSATPPDVSSLSATVGGSGVYLSWSPNATPGTTATYQIAYQSGDTAPSNCASGTVIAANTMYVNAPNDEVVGLTGGQDYSFRVCAANSDSSAFLNRGDDYGDGALHPSSTESSPTVFVSVNTYTGNLGGVYFGDFACQLEAHNASLGGTWRAILSTSSANANSRIVLNKAYYNLRPAGSGGPQLLTTTNTLWQGRANAVLYTASGTSAGSVQVWTGSNASGAYVSSESCSDWTSTSGNGEYGYSDHTGGNWINWSNAACTGALRRYCINQQSSFAAPAEVASLTTGTIAATSVVLNFTSGGRHHCRFLKSPTRAAAPRPPIANPARPLAPIRLVSTQARTP